jgi:hypothetical protein
LLLHVAVNTDLLKLLTSTEDALLGILNRALRSILLCAGFLCLQVLIFVGNRFEIAHGVES